MSISVLRLFRGIALPRRRSPRPEAASARQYEPPLRCAVQRPAELTSTTNASAATTSAKPAYSAPGLSAVHGAIAAPGADNSRGRATPASQPSNGRDAGVHRALDLVAT